ncbi:putative ATP-dependent RNA helicase spindle-E [Habropoda laboriosa]|uniref:Probable ATP-dependent RNA helicase spindle-E n=1 Tax=Habropoda laboriosa TaxID=597456 RepID=A0A0L7QTI6_9HYME|nr:putative ATP-dependent RNA helicase spindle-E [Habropoda laboriosa]
MDVLDIFSPQGKIQRKVLAGPSSRKKLPTNMSLLDAQINETIRNTEKGKDYIAEYIQEEEDKLLESANYNANDENTFDDISQGTNCIQDVNKEEIMKIYKTYDFAEHKKSSLTINSKKDEIVSMIETNSVVIIQGPTGCGKTTQVPQFILDSCYKKRVPCNIIVTQPRRIAAISITRRVCQERKWEVGSLVGYQVGLIKHTSRDTRLTYCTTGVLLHKLINSKNMLDYTHVILDEVHERDQDMDFLLLVVRKLLRTNSRSVKIILMSATFEVEKFAKYFSSPLRNKLVPAPIIDIGKQNYFNIPEVSEPRVTKKMMEFCVKLMKVLDDVDMKADDAHYEEETNVYERHVILVFLPGINEITEMHSMLALPNHEEVKWDIVILHSSITSEEQQLIFRKPPSGYRRVILSTNIAESSITVPDVKYVIDFCLVKQLVMDLKSNFQSLEIRWASKVNCVQRAGRAGRVMDGRVYRLVPQTFYEVNMMPQEVAPEMLRSPLENVVLKAKMLDMGDPKAILALSLDPPDLANLENTILLLKETGALVNKINKIEKFDGELTDLGRVMANLPLDIHVSKLIMLGHVFSVLKDTIIIAASLNVKDMFNNPFNQKLLAYNVRLSWATDSCSDCIAFMNVYKVWITEKANRRINSDAAEKKWAIRNFVQLRVLREVKALVTELTARLEKLGIQESAGVNKVVWKEIERPFVLKLVIAGAFYPNYFIKNTAQHQLNEHAGIKLLGGLDPSKTVYLQGWPVRQPGLLYARRIQEIFEKNLMTSAEKIRVSFDASAHLIKDIVRPELPGLRVSRIPIIIQHIKNPSRFWVQLRDPTIKKRSDKIVSTIENIKHHLRKFTETPKTGSLVIAPYEENNCRAYFRAVVEGHITSEDILVQVFFIDYGYSSECRLCDLRQLERNSDIVNIPALAIECKLANIQPSVAHNFSDDWSQAAYDLFWTLINKPGRLFGEIYSIANSVIILELIHKNEEEEISINQCLLEKNFAIKREENYFSRFNHNLRMKNSEMSDMQCHHYEKLQYSQDYMLDIYPDPPPISECLDTVNLRGPFSPLEIKLANLITAGRDKSVKIATNSVNSVLLDTDPEDFSQRLLVAGSISQSSYNQNLTLYNTTLMPRLPGWTALIVLIFTPYMELRRNDFGTYYTGALCGLGFDSITKKSIFSEHDIDFQFDAEITIDDLQYINRLRFWMNMGMQINHHSEKSISMEEIIVCQCRIKDALMKLLEKERKPQVPDIINNSDRWNLYDETLLLRPSKTHMVTCIYGLHNALELEKANELQEMTEHVRNLRVLTTEDPRKPENTNISCKLCNVTLTSIFDLRNHLYTLKHRQNEQILRIEL